MRRVVLVALVMLTSGAAAEEKPCTCRANGADIPLGELACIRLSSGEYLARCERVLNNTSWTKLRDGCPTAEAPVPGAVAG